MNERDLRAALERMAQAAPPPEDARAAEARRERVVPKMERALRNVSAQRLRTRQRMRLVGGLAFAASIALAVGIGWRMRASHVSSVTTTAHAAPARIAQSSGTVLVVHGGVTSVIAPSSTSAALASGDEIVTTPEATARVALASGAVIEVAPSTRIAFAIPEGALHDERISLSAGQASAHVPKLGAGESFVVVTPDAEVIVRGTSFVVSVRDEGTPRTRVSVSEGVVAVEYAGREFRVPQGEQWPSTAPATPAPPVAPEAAPPSNPSIAVSPTPSLRLPSTLGDQNALLQSALDARRSGDDARALKTLEELLGKYPASPLAQEAHVERFRALERMGRHSAAASEARVYLIGYPNGFARDEAKAIVLR